MTGLAFAELTPTSFLRRAAEGYGERTAIVDGDRRTSYREFWHRALVLTGALADAGCAPPSPDVLARLHRLGMDVTHLYGLTETFGPIAINTWQPQWDELCAERQALLRACQGVGKLIAEPLRVVECHRRRRAAGRCRRG